MTLSLLGCVMALGAIFSCSFRCFWSSSEDGKPRLHSKHGQELILSFNVPTRILKSIHAYTYEI